MDIVVLDVVAGHTFVDIDVLNPIRCELVERTAGQVLVTATDAKQRKETHYRNCAPG